MAEPREEWWRRLRPPSSVRARTTVAATLVVGVALVLGALAFVAALDTMLERELGHAAQARADQVAASLAAGGDSLGDPANDDEVVQLLDANGAVVQARPEIAREALAHPEPGGRAVVSAPIDEGDFLAVSADGPSGTTVVVARALDDIGETVRTAAGLLAVGVPLLMVVVGVTTWGLAGRALAPVDVIGAEVDEISAHQLHRRVPAGVTDDEISRLAATMNRMLDRLQAGQQRQRRFVSDASHELRSPVASIRQHAEVALAHPDQADAGRLATTVHAEALRVQRLVDALLVLARADENALALDLRPLDLDDLVLDEARHLRATTTLEVDTGHVSAGRVRGDRAALGQVIRNVSDNAARYARTRIALRLSENDAVVRLVVDDDGPGVPDADRERVLRRFVRLDEARDRDAGGAGLGLAIVAEIVAAHGGKVLIGRNGLGGTRAEVRLPRLDDAS